MGSGDARCLFQLRLANGAAMGRESGAKRVTYFVANSHYVARRIRRFYGRECW